MSTTRSLLLSALGLLALAAPAVAQVPPTLNLAGRLTSPDGTPLDGAYDVEVRLYAAPTGGTAIWTEAHDSVAADDGAMFVELGSATPFDTGDFDGGARWIEIRIDGAALSPRLPVGSVPYAFRADVASMLGDYGPEDLQARVSAACTSGSAIRAIAADGTVTCEADDAGSGDITGVSVGTGLSGGGSGGDVSVAVDTAVIQRRVGATCATGSAIRAIAADGTVSCEVDDAGISGVTAGTGLTGGGSSGTVSVAVDTAAIQRRVASCAPGSSIRAVAEDGAVTCQADTTGGNGDVTGVTAGTGLSGGGASGDVSLGLADGGTRLRHLSLPAGSRPTGISGVVGSTGYLFGSTAFTADGPGNCMVTVTATTAAPTYASGFSTVYVGWRAGATDAYDGGYGTNLGMTPSSASAWVSGTAAHVVPIVSGQSYQFGCYIWNQGTYVSLTYFCRVAYLCT